MSYLIYVASGESNAMTLFLGVIMMSLATTGTLYSLIADGRNTEGISPVYHYVFVLILSVCIVLMYPSRFLLFGSDTLTEWQTVRYLSSLGRWIPFDLNSNSLPLSTVPVMLAQVTGLGIDVSYWVLSVILVLFMPFLVIAVIKALGYELRPSLAISILYVQLWFYLSAVEAWPFKTRFALIFAMLSLLSLFQRERPHRFLSQMFMLGVVVSHYTISYLFGLLLLFLYIIPIVHGRIFQQHSPNMHRMLNSKTIAVYFTIMLSWLIYAATIGWISTVQAGRTLIDALMNMAFGETASTTSYAFESPRGPIVTAWFNLQNLLFLVGGFLSLYYYIRGRIKSPRLAIWIFAGNFLLLLTAFWAFTSLSGSIDTYRVIVFSLPFFAFFLHSFLKRVITAHVDLFKLLGVLFLVLMLPMNMMLPDYQNDSLFVAESSLSPFRAFASIGGRITPIDIEMAQFMEMLVPEGSTIHGDYAFVLFATRLMSSPSKIIAKAASYPVLANGDYLLVHGHYLRHGFWLSPLAGKFIRGVGRYSFETTVYISRETLFGPGTNIIYSDPTYTFLLKI